MYSFPVAVSECAFQGPFSSDRSCEAASHWLESASAQDFYFVVPIFSFSLLWSEWMLVIFVFSFEQIIFFPSCVLVLDIVAFTFVAQHNYFHLRSSFTRFVIKNCFDDQV